MKRSYIIFLVLVGLFVGCTNSFEDFNTDKKNPAQVAGNALFANSEKALVDQVYSTNVNLNIFKMMAQYWTETTYTDEANYLIDERNIPRNIYNAYYREAIKDMTSASDLIGLETDPAAAETIQNRQAIIEIFKVYCYQRLVDIFGNIPYSEAMNIDNVYPKYDDAATIYSDFLSKLDAAIAKLDPTKDSFGSSDLIYGGDVASWKKFANTLKIKIGIELADVNPAVAKSTIEGAVSGAFTSSADDATFDYLSASPNQNPLYTDLVASGRHDFVAANTIVDVMNNLEDPRRAFYFTDVDGEYIGGPYGEDNAYPNYSHINDAIQAPDYPAYLLTYDEMLFYLSEAAARGISVPKTAEQYYNEAIIESITSWGGTAQMASDYLAQADVAWATAPDASADGWREKIGTQSWIASYVRGMLGYTTWRRLDYPVFNVAPTIESTQDIPTRFTYPIEEQTLNAANYQSASSAIGGDDLTTKLFWDMHPAN